MTRAAVPLGLMVACAGVVGLAGGCTRESLRVALEAQRRADQVQQAVFDRQHEALCILLYRDLQRRLVETGTTLSAPQRAALNTVWNDRDLVEFWALQHERAAALRQAGVDAKLYADQSVVDLLWKSLEAKWSRARRGLAAAAVERAVAEAEAARLEERHE
ncbi:MAG: hypothetical protein AB1601_11120 [Planctomycetota bacterium]